MLFSLALRYGRCVRYKEFIILKKYDQNHSFHINLLFPSGLQGFLIGAETVTVVEKAAFGIRLVNLAQPLISCLLALYKYRVRNVALV